MESRSFTSTSESEWRVRAARWASCLAVALLCRVVQATPEYPGVLDQSLQTSCPDPLSRCLVCHTTALGGKTATQPFALSLREFGLNRGRDPGALQNALFLLPDDRDSDFDGTPDKVELFECLNPSGEEFGIPPEYGCDGGTLASPGPQTGGLPSGWLVAAGLLLLVVVARRGRRRVPRAR